MAFSGAFAMTKTRTCTTCSEEFPLMAEYFYKDATKSEGFTAECKACKKARSRANSKTRYALAKAVRAAAKCNSPAEAFAAFGEVMEPPIPKKRKARKVNHMARLGAAIAKEAKRLQEEQELAAQPTKACVVCSEIKPLGLFNMDTRTADGRSNVCKSCKTEQRKAKAEGREAPKAIRPITEPKPKKSSATRKRTRRRRPKENPMVLLAKAIAEHAQEELDVQRLNAKVELKRQENQRHCKAYVDWLIRNDGRPVKWGKVRVHPIVFAVAREGGTIWGWPSVIEEDREMAERYGRLPCLWSMSLKDALRHPEWLHLYDGWNPTNFLNFSAWSGLSTKVHFATLGATSVVLDFAHDPGELDVDAEWDAMMQGQAVLSATP